MKRALLIVMSVAILGSLGLYINKKPANSSAADSQTSSNTAAIADQTSNSVSNSGQSSGSSTSTTASSKYKDGTYTGSDADTPYGTVQVAAVISGGQITDIQFLKMPSDEQNSKIVTAMAEPKLKSETLQAQSYKIDFVTGATSTTYGYEQSLQAALDKAAA